MGTTGLESMKLFNGLLSNLSKKVYETVFFSCWRKKLKKLPVCSKELMSTSIFRLSSKKPIEAGCVILVYCDSNGEKEKR
jgi:hypothetical protein